MGGVLAESRVVACNSVHHGLQQVADAESALAIVVGSSHRGPVGRIAPGSVAERLLHGASCPVAVAPRGYSTQAYAGIQRVGVGYTPGPEAGRSPQPPPSASPPGRARRSACSASSSPRQVAATLPLGWGFGELEATKRDDLTRRIGHAIEDVAALVDISGQVVDGYADDELARLSQEVDLLICGSRGQGRIGNVTLGDASTGLLRKAECPVLVVPRGARGGLAALRAPAVEPA